MKRFFVVVGNVEVFEYLDDVGGVVKVFLGFVIWVGEKVFNCIVVGFFEEGFYFCNFCYLLGKERVVVFREFWFFE